MIVVVYFPAFQVKIPQRCSIGICLRLRFEWGKGTTYPDGPVIAGLNS